MINDLIIARKCSGEETIHSFAERRFSKEVKHNLICVTSCLVIINAFSTLIYIWEDLSTELNVSFYLGLGYTVVIAICLHSSTPKATPTNNVVSRVLSTQK